jgi:hypothetical protein
MKVMFEVYLVEGGDADSLLTDETKQNTGAQIMTPEQVASAGLADIPESDRARVFIVCSRSDMTWIRRALETHEDVADFRVHDLE